MSNDSPKFLCQVSTLQALILLKKKITFFVFLLILWFYCPSNLFNVKTSLAGLRNEKLRLLKFFIVLNFLIFKNWWIFWIFWILNLSNCVNLWDFLNLLSLLNLLNFLNFSDFWIYRVFKKNVTKSFKNFLNCLNSWNFLNLSNFSNFLKLSIFNFFFKFLKSLESLESPEFLKLTYSVPVSTHNCTHWLFLYPSNPSKYFICLITVPCPKIPHSFLSTAISIVLDK